MNYHTSDSAYDEREPLQLSTPELDDINQEAAILEWQRKGKVKANRQLIAKRLANANTHFLYASVEDLPRHSHPLWSDEEDANPLKHDEIIRQQLREWSSDKTIAIRSMMAEFLEESFEEQSESLPRIIRSLRRKGFLATPPTVKTTNLPETPGKLITVLYKAIQQQAQSIDSLYQLTAQVHSAKRPEAACRQALRRLMRQNLIKKSPDEVYSIVKEK